MLADICSQMADMLISSRRSSLASFIKRLLLLLFSSSPQGLAAA